jgi:aminopeptidase N
MHGYSAPVILDCPYTMAQLESIALFSTDVYCPWTAGQVSSVQAIKEIMVRLKTENIDFKDLVAFYKTALESHNFSNIAKSQLLDLPSLANLAQKLDCYDFELLNSARGSLLKEIAMTCKKSLFNYYFALPRIEKYEPTQEQMGVRELSNICLHLLVAYYPEIYTENAWRQYNENRHSQDSRSNNFTDCYGAFAALVENNTQYKEKALKLFYDDWKKDKTVFNYWLSSQVSGMTNIDELNNLTLAVDREGDASWGFDEKNPNHLRSIYKTFIENPLYFHRPDGTGYRFIINAILKIGQFNPTVSHNSLCVRAIANFSNLPLRQQAAFAKELRKLMCNESPSQTREIVGNLLDTYDKSIRI